MKTPLRMLSLCAGIGGADLAAEWTGAIQVIGQVELDTFCQAILARHWPQVPRLSDVRKVVGHEFGPLDLVVAGFPCQPFSYAGPRRGSQDERNLWPHIARILRAAQPRWFVGENVPGLLTVEEGRYFGRILADLASLGYRVGWAVYGASALGASHRRERLFILAYAPQKVSYTLADATGLTTRWQGAVGDAAASAWRNVANLATALSQRRGTSRAETTRALIPDGLSAHAWRGRAQSPMGRSADGLSVRLDGPRWPALPGEDPYPWEPSRLMRTEIPQRRKRLMTLGNAIVPLQLAVLFQSIVEIDRCRQTQATGP